MSTLCSCCGEDDTLEHYFWKCKIVQPFWGSLLSWWDKRFEVNIIVNEVDIILQISNYYNDPHTDLLEMNTSEINTSSLT
jgi:hypothetical protein